MTVKKMNWKVIAIASAVFVAGCGQSGVSEKTVENAATDVASAAPTAPKPVLSINEMMVMIVDAPGELLWDVEKEGHAPKTDEDWFQLQDHAVSLAAAATLIQLGGTGSGDNDWASYPEWKTNAQALVTAALGARQAAKDHDLATLTKMNGQIVDACQACHDKFKPDLPSQGIFMHTRPGTGLDTAQPPR